MVPRFPNCSDKQTHRRCRIPQMQDFPAQTLKVTFLGT